MIDTKTLSTDILRSIEFAIKAHIFHPKQEKDAVRFWDGKTPYIIHPTWCAMTILTETTLSESLRIEGYQALLWHDILEDTSIYEFPDYVSHNLVDLIRQMTFTNFEEEQQVIWSLDKKVRLLKLYDKTSNLLDGTWMKNEKWNHYVSFTRDLIQDVQANYGELNIVKIGNSIATIRN